MTNQWSWGIKPVNDDANDVENLIYARIIGARLKGVDDGASTAADLAKEILAQALKKSGGAGESRMMVRRVCRGTIRAMADISQDVPQTTRFLLKILNSSAEELDIAAKDLSSWCLEGIADVTLVLGPGPRANILKMIDFEFPGAGAEFTEICRKAKLKQWWTK